VGANSKEECLLGFGGGESGNSMKERKKERKKI